MKKIQRMTILFSLLAVVLAASSPGYGQERQVWQIGMFDRSSNEFRNLGVDYTNPKSDAIFKIGESVEANDWPRFQPGPANGMAGGRLHPFTILFKLTDKPNGTYRLTVGILYETPRLSYLRIEINGHTGVFYFEPTLDYGAGDWEGTFVPQTSTATKTIKLPAAWLLQGENILVLTALDEPAAVQISIGSIALGHTGIIYDALRLTQSASEKPSASRLRTSLRPTIFYRRKADVNAELVEALLSFSGGPIKGSATLGVAGGSDGQAFDCVGEFGDCRIEFAIPEWSGTKNALLKIQSNHGTTEVASTLTAARKWTVFIVPHEHLDIGFTDYPDKIAELHSQAVDGVLDLLPTHPEFRWTIDGSWVAEQYLNGRSTEKRDQFLQSIRDQKITLPMQYANQHTGVASLEGLARSLYPSKAIADEFSLPLGAAHIADVPSYSWSYASILHAAGVKYFAAASNSWRAPIVLQGRWNERSPFYWEGPDGGRVLMWYSRAYLQAHTLFGGPWRMESIRDSLPVFLQAYTRPDYTANTAIIFGTQLENTPLAREQSEIVASFSHEYAWPKFEFSTVHSAMQQVEHEGKGDFPVVRGDFGPYWEDGYGSDAAHTAIHRENQHRIGTAEIMGAAVSSIDTRVLPDKAMLDDAWRNELLYDEHTWTYVSATTQPEHHQSEDQIALKGSRAARARDDINESIQRGWAQLEALVRTKDT